ncbi:hypothetical protein, partial [Streptomyces sp. MK37H]|uniref:hypothetical protein n=1 Tax=Streptomyces sp. MK37H TaxID=2699117 RepID=UPI001B396DF0
MRAALQAMGRLLRGPVDVQGAADPRAGLVEQCQLLPGGQQGGRVVSGQHHGCRPALVVQQRGDDGGPGERAGWRGMGVAGSSRCPSPVSSARRIVRSADSDSGPGMISGLEEGA